MNILKVYIISADKVNLPWKKTESNLFELTEEYPETDIPYLQLTICWFIELSCWFKAIFLPNILGINAGYGLYCMQATPL